MIGKILAARCNAYPLSLPQHPTYPATTYQVISTTREHAQGTDATISVSRVQVDCWAETYSEVQTLAAQVHASLSRFKGTVTGITVCDILHDNTEESFEPDTGVYRVSIDYMIYLED